MYIKNRFLALLIRLCIAAASFWGIYRSVVIPGKGINLYHFGYYTILSNLVCLFFFLFAAVKTGMELIRYGIRGSTEIAPQWKGAVTMMITVTFLIYHFLLAPREFSMAGGEQFWRLSNLLLHYIVPLLVLLDWLLFDKKGRYKWYAPILWLFIPCAYLAFALLRAEMGSPFPHGSRYPYFFIDLDVLGWNGIVQWLIPITLFFLILGYLFYLLDYVAGGGRKPRFSKYKHQ